LTRGHLCPSSKAAESVAVPVWDVSVRVVHWLVVALFAMSWVTAHNGWMVWHRRSGYAILCLVMFRIYWGFCGASTARFSTFLRRASVVYQYARAFIVRRHIITTFGHNPLGGWSVMALLTALLVQAALGLFVVDADGLEAGPLATHISFSNGRRVAALHQLGFNVLLILSGAHIAAVVVHLCYQRENLVAPMVTGLKRIPRTDWVPEIIFVRPWRALLGITLIVAVTIAITGVL
jgi:cytochrome b